MGQENQDAKAPEPGLFGWAPLGKRGPGQPPHVATEKNRNKVKLLLALDRSTQQIANALGITPPTLRKHYFSELKVRDMARDALEAEMLESLYAQAVAGNVGAFKQMQARLDRVDMERRARLAAGEKSETDKPLRPVAKGKKEQALDSAADVLASHPLFDPLRLN